MARKYIKQGDTKPYIRATLKTITGDPLQASAVDLTSATVKFLMKERTTGTLKVDATLAGSELVDVSNGQVQYEWGGSGDTDTIGDYVGEFEVTYSDSSVETFYDLRSAQDVADELPPELLLISIIDDLG